MKLYVQDPGDMSVGIWPGEYILELPFIEMDKEERLDVKNEFVKFCSKMFDFKPIYACYEDECADCGKLSKECNCMIGD